MDDEVGGVARWESMRGDPLEVGGSVSEHASAMSPASLAGIVLLSVAVTFGNAAVKRQTQGVDDDRIVFEDELQNIVDGEKPEEGEGTPPVTIKSEVFINGQYVNSERYTTTEPSPTSADGNETETGWINHSSRGHITVHRHRSRYWQPFYLEAPHYYPTADRVVVTGYQPWQGGLVEYEPLTFQYVHIAEGHPLAKRSHGSALTFPGEKHSRPSNCNTNCPTTPEYNPVCGDDAITYTNPSKLHCTVWCGKRVKIVHYGNCIRSTTQPPTTRPSRNRNRG